jgi:adenylate cyclase
VPAVAPALAWGLAGGASFGVRARREAKAQRQLVSLFRRFSSAKVADHLWRERAAFMAGGRPRPQRVVLTALMSDLEGYTSAAEKLEPEALLAWIDGYMDAMTRVIEAHGGHVDDYVGDGIKANFGVPIPSTSEAAIDRDAAQAVACALAMGRALDVCNRDWAARGLPEARQRIGIATGPAVVGAIGSRERMKYTSVGDVVNTAARLESLAPPEVRTAAPRAEAMNTVAEPADDRADERPEAGRILIGEETRRRIGDRFALRDLGTHRLKGKADPVRVFRVLGARERRGDGSDRSESERGEGEA